MSSLSFDAPSAVGVAIVEDSAMLRELIEEAVTKQPGLNLVASVRNVRDALDTIPWDEVQFATIDLQLPDGVGLMLGQELRRKYPRLRVAILSDHRRPNLLDVIPIGERHFWSYILKSSVDGRQQLGELLAFAAHHAFFDQNINVGGAEGQRLVAALTDQQREILSLVARGLSNAAIGRKLTLAAKSVEYHLRQIYLTLGLAGDADSNQRVSATVLYLRRFSDPDSGN